jgi:hypothetical protein
MRFESIALALTAASVATAFSTTLDNGSNTRVSSSSTRLDAAASTPRRAFLTQAGTTTAAIGAASVLAFGLPSPAAAYVASAAAMDPSVAMRTVKSTLRRLKADAFVDYVAFNEYESLRKALRDSPFSEVRKSCTSLIRTVQGGTFLSSDAAAAATNNNPSADVLSAKYRTFVASMERMDATASVAVRGRQIEPGELKAAYSATVSALQEFLSAAQDAVGTTGSITASLQDGIES